MPERPMPRQQRRALERAARKGGAKTPSLETAVNPQVKHIVNRLEAISEANTDKDLAQIESATRAEIIALSVKMHLLARPSRYSQRSLEDSIIVSEGVAPGFIPTHSRLTLPTSNTAAYMPESYDPSTGKMNIWMGAEMLSAAIYQTNPNLEGVTPALMLPQVLSHALLHKEAQAPNSPDTGFSDTDPLVNELVTEFLRTRSDLRTGLPVISSYAEITAGLSNLERVLAASTISENTLYRYFVRRDLLGLAVLMAAKRLPDQYSKFKKRWPNGYDPEIDDQNYDLLLATGLTILRQTIPSV